MKNFSLFCCVIFFFGCRPKQLFEVQLAIANATITNQQLDSTVVILKRRLDLLKDEKATIRVDRPNKQIAIQTSSIRNESEAWYFASAGQVEFSECYTIGEISPMLEKATAALESTSTENKSDKGISDLLAGIEAPENLSDLLSTNPRGASYPDNTPELGVVRQANRERLVKLLSKVSTYFPNNIKFLFGKSGAMSSNGSDNFLAVYAIKTNPENQVDRSCIETVLANTDYEEKPIINIKFNRTGTYRWRLMTKMNINRPIVVSVDGQVFSAPIVLSELSRGDAQISGVFTMQEAESLANAISTGEMPLRLKFKSITKL
jgi:preprotein translocase subunit SecD